jgi:uncharacterized protein YjbI with pentapeptide repeats
MVRHMIDDPKRNLSLWPMRRSVLLIIILAFIIFTGSLLLLLFFVGSGKSASPHLDIIKVALAIVAGSGGLVAIVVTYRRQQIAEDAHREIVANYESTKYDATERRNTEVYTKAIEQLGNDKAHVRLGGIYALDRLASLNPQYRQMVFDVWCGYLRMARTVPIKPDIWYEQQRARQRAKDLDERASATLTNYEDNQELQVRLTIQRALKSHLVPADKAEKAQGGRSHLIREYWSGLSLNLTGAYLAGFDLSWCQVEEADLSYATLSGMSWFVHTDFVGPANFEGANFLEGAFFDGAEFLSQARFASALFRGVAFFEGVEFRIGTKDLFFSPFNTCHFEHAILVRNNNIPTNKVGEMFTAATATTSQEFSREVPSGWRIVSDPKSGVSNFHYVPLK